MANIKILIFHCTNTTCGLRFTALSDDSRTGRCPVCWQPTQLVGGPYPRNEVDQGSLQANSLHLEVFLDNIRSAWNVGSMMRSADGAGIDHVHLGGVTPGPENPKVAKTGLGAESALAVSRHPDGLAFCKRWKAENGVIWALEGGDRSESLFKIVEPQFAGRLLLVAGNELTGVDPEILEVCDKIVFLPMSGYKGSLNVAVAFGIAIYTLRFGLKEPVQTSTDCDSC